MAHLCKRVISEQRTGNLHFFVNSVNFIARVIKRAELKPEDVKIVCSSSGESAIKNQAKLGADYLIEQPSDPVKKINFYTSTAFEGCDIYDKQGRTYIVSDSRRAHTLMDISTMFIQICGRIRDSIYKSDITHIYSTTRYSNVSFDEFKERTSKTLSEAIKFATDINNVPDDSRKIMLSKIPYLNEKYVRVENNRLTVDNNLANITTRNINGKNTACITIIREKIVRV